MVVPQATRPTCIHPDATAPCSPNDRRMDQRHRSLQQKGGHKMERPPRQDPCDLSQGAGDRAAEEPALGQMEGLRERIGVVQMVGGHKCTNRSGGARRPDNIAVSTVAAPVAMICHHGIAAIISNGGCHGIRGSASEAPVTKGFHPSRCCRSRCRHRLSVPDGPCLAAHHLCALHRVHRANTAGDRHLWHPARWGAASAGILGLFLAGAV